MFAMTDRCDVKNTNGHQCRKVSVFTIADVAEVMSPDMLDEEKCRRWILQKLHPDGPFCPRCGAPIDGDRVLSSWWSLRRVCCKNCGRYFTAATGTMVNGINISFRQVFLMAWCFYLGLKISQVAELCQLHADTAKLWRIKFKCLAEGESDAD
jgi:transposase-like protein